MGVILRERALASLEGRKDVDDCLHVVLTHHTFGVTASCFELRDFPGPKTFRINTWASHWIYALEGDGVFKG